MTHTSELVCIRVIRIRQEKESVLQLCIIICEYVEKSTKGSHNK